MCQEFLSRHRLLASQYHAPDILAAFLDEMEKGLAGRASSLAMIPSYVHVPKRAPQHEKIIVIDAGGTHFRTAVVRFDRQSVPRIEDFVDHPMPGVAKEVGRDEFFDLVVDYLEPVLKESRRLGFCFSYPALIDPQRDGQLLYWTKEIKAPGVVGEKILANLSRALDRRGLARPTNMIILNDTVASLLAGVTSTRFSTDYNYLGLILGTGTNIAYIESNARIRKEPALAAGGSMAINCESANFDKVERGDIDLAFDQTTASPGRHVLEKMISGGYLGGLCSRVLDAAAAEGVISQAANQKLKAVETLGTPFLSGLLAGAAGTDPNLADVAADELRTIRTILSGVVERAAVLTAINMAAPVIKSATDDRRKKKFCISADGSVYYKLYSFRERAEKHLAEILKPYGVEHQIVQVDEAPLIGAAVAGLVD